MSRIEIDLDNKEAAMKEVKKIQGAIDELLSVCNDQKAQLQENVKTMTDAEKVITDLTSATKSFSEAFLNVQTVLHSKRELFEGDAEMKILLDSIATLTLESGNIKLMALRGDKK